MPIYEYRCRDCGRIQEFLILNGHEQEIVCPNCGSKQMEKVISPASFMFSDSQRPAGRTCCGREERCSSPPCETEGRCRRGKF